MNRSVLSEVLHATTLHIAPGALTVARSFRHPTRGLVDCPAHHLLAERARRAGFIAADSLSLPDTDLRDALPAAPTTVFTVSYEKPEGGHRGLALAAHSHDPAAIAFAHREIESWRAVLRTRRLLYVVAPTTAGTADGPRKPGSPVPSQTTDACSPWQPCGCPADVSCPATANAQRALRRFLDRGDEVVAVGIPVAGTGTWPAQALRSSAVRLRTPQEAELLTVTDPDRLAFVVTPGATVSAVAEILHVLRRRYPRLRGQHPREWCYTMDDLHTVVASTLAQSDTLLVTGQESAPVVRTAVTQAALLGVGVRDVTEPANLRPGDIDGATVTLLDATPDGRGRREIGQALDGLGPTSHVRREVRSYPEPSHEATRTILAR